MALIRRPLGHFGYLALGLMVMALGAFAVAQWSPPAKAAVATTYQNPCQPYGQAYYDFGQYVSGWGYHSGEDVCHAAGAAVHATANGRVVYSARTPDSYRWGNLILIEHANADGSTVVSLYGHLADNRQVSAGQEVTKGQVIGSVGPSYTASNGNWGAHLHFGIHHGGYGAAIGSYASWIRGYENSGTGIWTRPSAYINGHLAAYDYVPVAVGGSDVIPYNSHSSVTFKVRNTGTSTWRKDGNSNNPVRLGTISPRDRGSGFAQNGPGWAGPSRIKLDNDVSPGAEGTFTARFSSNRVPGSYHECFSVMVEGVGWMSGAPTCVIVHVQQPSYRAEYVTQAITNNHDPMVVGAAASAQNLLPGQKLNAKVMLKNVGELPWDKDGSLPVRLGTSSPLDRASGFATGGDTTVPTSENWPGYNRASSLDGHYDPASKTVSEDDQIETGEVGVFSFTVTAPSQPGNYTEYFTPMVEGALWMNNLGLHLPLRVLQPGYHFEPVTQNFTTKSAGSSTSYVDATLQVRNAGQASWPVGGNLRLGTDQPLDHQSQFYTGSGSGSWIAPNRLSSIDRNVTDPSKQTIEPGEVAEFAMRLNVPPLPVGTYPLHVRPVMEGVTWLPENYASTFQIKVTVPPYDSQIVAQTFSQNPTGVAQGSPLTANLAVKNTGRAAWSTSGPNAVRLGTNRPVDRASTLQVTGGNDPWLSAGRASAIDGKVTDLNSLASTPAGQINPGETALFKVPLKTGLATGSYTEHFNLVAEGITWLPDEGIFFPLTIKPADYVPPTPSPTPTPGPGQSQWSTTGNTYESCVGNCTRDTAGQRVYGYSNYKVSYQTPNLNAGSYAVTLNYGNISGALPVGYGYNVNLRINDGTVIPVTLPANQTSVTVSNVPLSGAAGVSLEWTNDYYVPGQFDANLALSNLSAIKQP